MLSVENITVHGLQEAVRGMRNPLNSWDKSDSELVTKVDEAINGDMMAFQTFVVGESDMQLMKRLFMAGPDHRKFMRMIVVYMDITAPLYWWKQFDTYKVGTVVNSCSTMHTLTDRPFTLDDFSHDKLPVGSGAEASLLSTIRVMNELRSEYMSASVGDRRGIWYQIVQIMPDSYNQRRTAMISLESLWNMVHQREHHKLDEWHVYCDIARGIGVLDGLTR